MSDLKIEQIAGGYWDLVIENNDFVVVGDTEDTWPDYVKQRVVYVIMTWLGESGFDRSKGFPWEESVFGRQPIEGIPYLLQDQIVALDEVDGMDEPPVLELDSTSRRLSIVCSVRAAGFEVPVSVTIESGSTDA